MSQKVKEGNPTLLQFSEFGGMTLKDLTRVLIDLGNKTRSQISGVKKLRDQRNRVANH